MSNNLQDINSIAPMADAGDNAGSTDPLQIEYQEGKRQLAAGDFGAAAISLHNALVGFEEKGDDTGIANASNQLGQLCMQREDYHGAEEHFRRAYDLCQKLGDPLSLNMLQRRFIEVHRGSGEYGRAIEVCLDLLDLYHGNNDPKGTVEVLEIMADTYRESGKTEKAVDALRTIASIHRNFKHHSTADEFLARARELESSRTGTRD